MITALLLAGRIGASIAAEIGTMRVNEEIDALHTLGISPIRYLAMPRFIGCITMLPILVVYASLVGMFGGAVIASAYFDMSLWTYFKGAFDAMECPRRRRRARQGACSSARSWRPSPSTAA